MKYLIATIMLVMMMSCSSSHSIAGTWRGSFEVQDTFVPVVIYIEDLGDGKYAAKFDNPSQNVYGKSFDAISYKDGKLTLSSVQFDAIYAGDLSEDKKRFEGELDFRGEYYSMTLVIDKKK